MRVFIPYIVLWFSISAIGKYDIGDETTENFKTKTLIEVIEKSSKPISLDGTLEELYKDYPNLFSNYVLMYKSRSLQESSFLYPRVILNSKDAKTLIAYNGRPDHRGFNSLEVVEFDEEAARFIFREITFQEGDFKVSKENPQKCLKCHQSSHRIDVDPRPNWEPYNVWPGAYGSEHSSKLFVKGSPIFDSYLYELRQKEKSYYDLFLKEILPFNSRYKNLSPMNYPGHFPLAIDPFTNSLTEHLGRHNFKRISRIISETSLFKDYDFAIYGFVKCSKFDFPQNLYNWHSQRSNLSLSMKTERKLSSFFDFTFKAHDIDTSDWSMTFGTNGQFAFDNSFGLPSVTNKAMSEEFLNWMKSKEFDRPCDEINQIGYQKLENAWNSNSKLFSQELLTHSSPLVNRCIKCHESNLFDGTPSIPFSDPFRLSQLLKKDGFKQGNLYNEILYRIGPHATFIERMPADGYLPSHEETQEFIHYLNDIKL